MCYKMRKKSVICPNMADRKLQENNNMENQSIENMGALQLNVRPNTQVSIGANVQITSDNLFDKFHCDLLDRVNAQRALFEPVIVELRKTLCQQQGELERRKKRTIENVTKDTISMFKGMLKDMKLAGTVERSRYSDNSELHLDVVITFPVDREAKELESQAAKTLERLNKNNALVASIVAHGNNVTEARRRFNAAMVASKFASDPESKALLDTLNSQIQSTRLPEPV